MRRGRQFARRLLTLLQALAWNAHVGYSRMVNPLRVTRLLRGRALHVHLGCGGDRLDGFVNVDCRVTRATDCVADLNAPTVFAPGSIRLAYSHAFFEHLYRPARLSHLKAVRVALAPEDGACLYLGLPYFPAIARLYLDRGPGVVGPVFDLYNVYRYTHGDPEHVPHYWLEQLHKSLFDEQELSTLLTVAGFASSVMFSYCFTGELGRPVSMGFFARSVAANREALQDECVITIRRVAGHRVILDTLKWLEGDARVDAATGVLAPPDSARRSGV
jgi:hypothetical protein